MKRQLLQFWYDHLRPLLWRIGAMLLRPLPVSSLRGGVPKGVIWNSSAWIEEREARLSRGRRGADQWQIKVRDAEIFNGKPPHTVEPAVHPLFHHYRFYKFPELTITYIRNGRVVFPEGTVISPDGLVFDEFVHQWGEPVTKNRVFKVLRLPEKQTRPGIWATLVVSGSSRSIGHWLFDGLFRLSILEKAGLADCANLILPATTSRYTEIMEALGYPPSRYDGLNNGHWEVEQLLVPSFLSVSGILRPWACRWIRERLNLDDKPVGSRRLWVSRRQARWRRVLNEEEIISRLHEEGFEAVELEGLSFREQAALFAQAQIIAGPHGAGMTNLLFAPHGCRVLEIFPPRFINPVFFSMANALDQEYHYFTGSTPKSARHPGSLTDQDHFFVPFDLLDKTLKGLRLS